MVEHGSSFAGAEEHDRRGEAHLLHSLKKVFPDFESSRSRRKITHPAHRALGQPRRRRSTSRARALAEGGRTPTQSLTRALRPVAGLKGRAAGTRAQVHLRHRRRESEGRVRRSPACARRETRSPPRRRSSPRGVEQPALPERSRQPRQKPSQMAVAASTVFVPRTSRIASWSGIRRSHAVRGRLHCPAAASSTNRDSISRSAS